MPSHRLSTSAISWLDSRTVFPLPFSARMHAWRERRPSVSRPAVGSSRNRMSGFPVSASAKWSRRFCPVDISRYCLSARASAPRAASMARSGEVLFHFAKSRMASFPLI